MKVYIKYAEMLCILHIERHFPLFLANLKYHKIREALSPQLADLFF